MNKPTLAKESFILTRGQLSIDDPKKHERGQQTPDGAGYLIRFPELERIVWQMPENFIITNPFQPREDFPEADILKTMASLESVGQENPIATIPLILGKTNKDIKLILLDGEIRTIASRRLRRKHLDGIIKWEPDNDRLFERSAILNLVRTGHNPIETAKIFRRLLDNELKKGISKKEAMKRVRTAMKTTDFAIYSHLQLLTLSEQIQTLIRKGLITATAAFLIPQAKRKLGDKLDEAILAQELLKQAAGIRRGRPKKSKKPIEEPATEAGTGEKKEKPKEPVQRITRTGVQAALREVRRKTFSGDAVSQQELNAINASSNVVRFGSEISELQRATRLLLEPVLRKETIEAMRNRGYTPPEVTYDKLQKLLATVQEAFDYVIKPALLPEPLEIPEGAQNFTDIVKSMRFKEGHVKKIALLLAKGSDNKGEIFTAKEICKTLKEIDLSPVNIGPIFRTIIATLRPKGLTIDTQEKRIRDAGGYLNKTPGYRLRWIKKGEAIEDKKETEIES